MKNRTDTNRSASTQRTKRAPAPKSTNGSRIGLWLLAFVLVAVVTVFVIKTRLLTVEVFLLEGNTALTVEEVRELSDIGANTPIDKVDIAAAKRAVEKSGAHEVVDMEVVYPNTVRMTVNDRTRAALVLLGGYVVVIDENSYVMEVAQKVPESPNFYVFGTDAALTEVGKQLKMNSGRRDALKATLNCILAQHMQELLKDINVEDPESITMTTREDTLVKLGNAENMEEKMSWAKTALVELESDMMHGGTVDVTGGKGASFKAD